MDPKLQTGNVQYDTDEHNVTSNTNPTTAKRMDFGARVVVAGKVTMDRGRMVTTRHPSRMARKSVGARGRVF